MNILALLPLLYCLVGFHYQEKPEVTLQLNDQIKGKWTHERAQIQYIVDSHLVHEKEISTERGTVYAFDGTKVQVTYKDGTTAQGTYSVVTEDGSKKVILHLPPTTTTYLLIAVTPASMTWQKDLEDVYYDDGSTRKAAERAIYTEEFKQ